MTLAHDISGSGPTLVLVHGIVHRRQAWDSLLDQLTPYRRVVTVDLPGHGDSALPELGTDVMGQLIDDVSEFITEVTPPGERAHVAGNSLGGWISLCLAARGDVASATALSPAGFFVNHLDQVRAIGTFQALRSTAKLFGDGLPRALQYKLIRYPALAAFFAHPSHVDYSAALADCRSLISNELVDLGMELDFVLPPIVNPAVPVTVAWGRRDLILPVYQAQRVKKPFPQAKLIVLPGVGHVPMTDSPELISSILLAGSELRR
ncbi:MULTISPECIES: alpha/beta fold hydrolase [Rhodococcus]|uniref:Alpha/beta fold hydrolase n=1 Tax=Rhodococcus globerulus TaxID=33008 RepID=A0ABU4BU57_RHOGO|nr:MULTISPECIES: alpha/beta fold hydrolase [Rhodococcus]MDV6267724.1 alpha/beta fold hydrolase [Rhodococcus globerulus]MDV8065717.1 alpha/beta fold hydrolase [Rhodococcus sp. IEGM 1366]